MKIATNTAKLLRNVPLPDEVSTVHDSAVVLDIGSGETRIGLSGDFAPRLVARTVVGTGPGGQQECLQKAYRERDTLKISSVMERGLVKNWDGMEALLSHVDGLLGISKDTNTPLLLTEAALVPREQREQLTQILFEKIKVPAVYFSPAPVLGMYASGCTSGLAVEMGHGTCHTVPIFEGFSLFHSILQLDFGGDDLTSWLGNRITAAGTSFARAHQHDIWQYIKESNCAVFEDRKHYASAMENRGVVASHTLPDGTVIHLNNDIYSVCESLFDPTLLKSGSAASSGPTSTLPSYSSTASNRGIHQLAAESIRKCDQDIASLLCGNVIITGGGSLFSGFPERFNKELQDLMVTEKVRVQASTERKDAAFVGGSILASLPTFQDYFVTRADFNEYGSAQVTSRNCF